MTTPDQIPVAIRGLQVDLGGAPVLRGVDLEVSAGESVAVLGDNGSGKSTLIRALLGLVRPRAGEVRLFGSPPQRFGDWARVGYVPQRSAAIPRGASVGEVVRSGRLPLRRPFHPFTRADKVAVDDALELVGLSALRGADLVTLSGGQQQRALIARALVCEPELLVFDEPAAGVDLEHQRILAGLISRLLAGGTTMLVVLHELGAIGETVHRAVRLRDGLVVSDRTLGEAGVDRAGLDDHRHGTPGDPSAAADAHCGDPVDHDHWSESIHLSAPGHAENRR